MPDRRSRATRQVPPMLRPIIRAARMECPPGHAEALAALAAFAQHKVPARGIFDPGERDEPDFLLTIESVARMHLEFAEARAAWRQTLSSTALSASQRSDIESATHQIMDVSDTAHYYAGLAFGLTYSTPWRQA